MPSQIHYPLMFERPGIIAVGEGAFTPGYHIRDLTPFHDMYARGVRLFQLDATPTEDIYHPDLRAWVAPGQFDYRVQAASWERLLADCPEAQLCLRIYVASPPWWDEQHPEELQRYADGRAHHEFLHTKRQTLPSLASQRWRQNAMLAMSSFLDWLDSSGWAARVWGLFLCYGITWEWGILGSDDFLDYSLPMQERFREWLRASYGDEESLRAAWGNPEAAFQTAAIPTPEERQRGDNGLRIFPRDRAAFDFQRCLSHCNVDYLLDLAGSVRAAAGDRYQVGTFYGYTLTAREYGGFSSRAGAGGLAGGHHDLERVLNSGLLDFLGSPYGYSNRDLATGLLIEHFPLRSAREHGLHGYAENDLWTFTNQPSPAPPISVGNTDNRTDSIAHQRLALGAALCRGGSHWWTDLTHSQQLGREVSNYSDEAIKTELGRHVELFEILTESGHPESNAQIALVIDERAKDALGIGSELFLREVYRQLERWAWCGAPFDVWLSSDITAQNMAPYRLAYVFAPLLNTERRQELSAALCNSGRTVWWSPHTGWLTETGPSDAAFAALTGFETPELGAALQRCEQGKWISLYGACADLSAPQLAEVADRAGVHCYGVAPLQVMASDSLVCVHVAEGGERTLHLGAGEWRELFDGEAVKANKFRFADNDVRLFEKTSK